MCAALEADHMVATVGLLTSRIAGRAGAGMKFHVHLTGFFFSRQFTFALRIANNELAVPACFADSTESECAVGANGKPLGGWNWPLWKRGVTLCHFTLVLLIGIVLKTSVKRFRLLRSSGSLTPLTWTIHGCSIRFQGLFAF